MAGGLLGQSMLTPAPGFQGAPSSPQLGVPSGSGAQMNQQINNEINGTQPNGEATPAIPAAPGQPGTPAEGNAEGTPGAAGTAGAAAVAPVESLMQWGALHLHAGVSYQFLYDSEVHTAPGESTATTTHTITVPITAQIGPHVTLNYTPSYRIFSEKDFHNTLDHYASLSAGAGYGDWQLGLFQTFSRTDEPLVETSTQTGVDAYDTGASATYHLTDKISLQTSGSMDFIILSGNNNPTNIVFTGGGTNTPAVLANSQSYSGSEWFNYQINEKLGTGVGFTLSYQDQQGGFRSVSQQYEGRVTWHPGEKLMVSMTGGIEDQQFLNTDAPDNVTPIFSAVASYQVFEHTSLSLQASRTVDASLFEQQITETSEVGIGIQQRLLGKLNFTAGFSYSSIDFKTTTGPLIVARTDDIQTYNVGLSLPFLNHGNAGVFYSFTDDSSSSPGFSYTSSEVGATLSWNY